MGLDQSAISLTFTGKRRMKFEEAADIARLFGLPVSDILRHAGLPVDEQQPLVTLGGFLDSQGEVHCIAAQGDRVPAPMPMPAGSYAVQCRTAGSPLEYMDGWMMYVEPPIGLIDGTAPPPVGQFCVMQIRNGIATVGTIRRGYQPGRWNVSGPVATIQDANLDWAARIVKIRT